MTSQPDEPIWAPDLLAFKPQDGREQFDARTLVGLIEPQARQLASEYGCVVAFIDPSAPRRPRRLVRYSHRIRVLVADDRVTRVLGVG